MDFLVGAFHIGGDVLNKSDERGFTFDVNHINKVFVVLNDVGYLKEEVFALEIV